MKKVWDLCSTHICLIGVRARAPSNFELISRILLISSVCASIIVEESQQSRKEDMVWYAGFSPPACQSIAIWNPRGRLHGVQSLRLHECQRWRSNARSVTCTALDPVGLSDGLQTFEPRFSPAIAVAALFAATPPIVFWSRIFLNALKRSREEALEEQDRQDRLDRLVGRKGQARDR
eukprot:jgi/Botrbrau1/8689/Bobra.0311s0004.1